MCVQCCVYVFGCWISQLSAVITRSNIYTIVWFLRAPRWYIGPTAMPRAAVTPIAPERSEGAIGCDSRPRHCRRDDIPAWRPNKITLLTLLPLDLTMYHRFISFLCVVQSLRDVNLIPDTVCKSKQWASRDALIQSAGSISNSARYHSDANIALGPILKMYISGQIRIFNALNSDGYSTGNAPPSGNNVRYFINDYRSWGRISIRCWVNKRRTYLALMGELWGVFSEY